MSGMVFFALVALADPSEAAGAPQIVVSVEDGASLPDGVDREVRDALISRSAGLHAGLIQIHLRERLAEIRVDTVYRTVPIQEWESGAAVRVVVLHAVDLASPPTVSPTAPPAPDEAPPTVVTTPASAPATSPAVLVVSAAPRLSRGVQDFDALALGAELSAGVRRGAGRLSVGLRWSHGFERDEGTANAATFNMVLGTLSAGWSFSRLEATFEPFIGGARVTTGFGPKTGGVVYGAGAGLRWLGRPLAGIAWFAGVGLDYYANRIRYEISGYDLYATPRVAPYATLGATFGARP